MSPPLPLWRVPVRGRFTDDARAAVDAAGIQVWSGHSGRGFESTSLVVGAGTREQAMAMVQPALEGHDLFIDAEHVSPLPSSED